MPCHANKGSYKPTVWTPERNRWLVENTKGMKRQEAYELFCATFPEIQTTLVGVSNQRSRLRCSEYSRKHPSTKRKPLYSEQVKSGYVNIKVAQPSEWWSKAKWVWVETHPGEWEDVEETDSFYFLDGDNRNFDPANIEKVHRREQVVFIEMGGVVPGHPEETKLNILRARLKLAQLDAGENIPGAVVKYGSTRMFREDVNRKVREYSKKRYHNDPEYRANRLRKQKESLENNPERKARVREYQREWARKKRQEAKK